MDERCKMHGFLRVLGSAGIFIRITDFVLTSSFIINNIINNIKNIIH